MTEVVMVEIWGTDSRDAPEVLLMMDPEAAIRMGQDRSHRWGVRQVVVKTESSLVLAQFTGWMLWKPDAAHRHASDEADCAFDHSWNEASDD